ncbi:hypothetical protein O1611_g488 [Lasiodiplodia mahajangana]|uniref:Uncharacterized protein n=1 Tax=Lasiodiplodia mahajangana TaxID=1108764 RepID=A0ACC2K0T4_9PEZI|nr:hypothetical protein O1611_g488 [Lasiodiplodia mahajangana]
MQPGNPVKPCQICGKVISSSNFSRHVNKHRDSDQKECAQCNTSVRSANWARHIKSQKHLEQTASQSQLQSRSYILFADFINTTEEPLTQLASAYRREIARAGGLSTLDSDETSWTQLGIPAPRLIPAAECWGRVPSSMDEYKVDMLHHFDKSTTKIYCRGKPWTPLEDAPIHRVLSQLDQPDVASALCAINIRTQCAEVKLPERMSFDIYEDSLITETNITPQFAGIDLHIDHGLNVITLLYGGCIKLWALYPPTKQNYKRFKDVYSSHTMFVDLQNHLEGGKFCIQTEEQALYLPPGCIHSTYTLSGGFTLGTTFTTSACLDIAASVADLEKGMTRTGMGGDYSVFLRAVLMSLREQGERQKEAMTLLCSRYAEISGLRPKPFTKLRSKLAKTCSICHRPWARHTSRWLTQSET